MRYGSPYFEPRFYLSVRTVISTYCRYQYRTRTGRYAQCVPPVILCNLIYSSVFREMKKYQKDFSSWCGECQREKKERQRQSLAATKMVVLHIF
ncbi:hypothetical protein GW17_00032314 [Ensete ventricosum]|nr:hypothetical protein GW17_00032314 [Ensete ventricosum]